MLDKPFNAPNIDTEVGGLKRIRQLKLSSSNWERDIYLPKKFKLNQPSTKLELIKPPLPTTTHPPRRSCPYKSAAEIHSRPGRVPGSC